MTKGGIEAIPYGVIAIIITFIMLAPDAPHGRASDFARTPNGTSKSIAALVPQVPALVLMALAALVRLLHDLRFTLQSPQP